MKECPRCGSSLEVRYQCPNCRWIGPPLFGRNNVVLRKIREAEDAEKILEEVRRLERAVKWVKENEAMIEEFGRILERWKEKVRELKEFEEEVRRRAEGLDMPDSVFSLGLVKKDVAASLMAVRAGKIEAVRAMLMQ